MRSATKKRLRAWIWPVASALYGVSEMVRAAGDVTAMSLEELLERGAKAAPFVIIGLIMRRLFLENPEADTKDKKPSDYTES